MQFTALQIATLINGKIEGNPDAKVSHVAKIEEAAEGSLSFIANPKYEEFYLRDTMIDSNRSGNQEHHDYVLLL